MRTPASLMLLLLLCLPPPAVADDAVPDPLDSAQQRYLGLIADGRNAEAIVAGQEVADIVRGRHGADSLELALPLTNLGTAQLRNGNLTDAEASYLAAIALLERHDSFVSPRLANPLLGLGEAYLRDGQYGPAAEAFERALRVNHVNEGFYNLEQIPIRDGLTESYLGLRKLDKANFHQEAQVSIQERKLGSDNPELVTALNKLGGWYRRSGQAQAARLVYQGAARLVEKSAGEDSPEMVEPLLAVAMAYRQEALLPAAPDSSQSPETLLPMSSVMLRKALAIVQQQEPPDEAQRARILVELGDLYMIWGKRNTAADRYGEAWQALSGDPALAGRRDEYFGSPVRIIGREAPVIYPEPSPRAPPPDRKKLEPGFVVVSLDVDALGRVTRASVVEADPANLLEDQVRDAARAALYRPRYVDGAPVATTGLLLRHAFRFAPAKLDRAPATLPGEADKPLEQPMSGPGG